MQHGAVSVGHVAHRRMWYMKNWLYIWVLLPSVACLCEAEQLSAKWGAAIEALRVKHFYSAPALRSVEDQLYAPQGSVAALTDLAGDTNTEIRMIAIELLAGLGNPDSAKPLWKLTRDDNEAVRTLAVWALSRLNESVPVLPDVSGLKDSRANVRRLTAETLAHLHNPSVETDLIGALSDPDDLARWQAVVALDACGSQRAIPALSLCLKDSSARVRRTTAGVLGKFGDATVITSLVASLNDADWQTRLAVADALATLMSKLQLDQQTMTDTILSKLHADDFVLFAALHKLGLANDERALTSLVRALTGSSNELASHAAYAIVGLRITPVLSLLVRYSRDSNQDVRQRVLKVFGAIGGANEVPLVIAALDDPSESVQLVAVNALCQLRQYVPSDRLVEKLANSNPFVRAATARFFGELGDARYANTVATLLFDENRFVRSAAANALRTFGDRRPIEMLIELLARHVPNSEATGQRKTEGHGVILGTSRPLPPLLSGLELLAQKAEAIKVLGDWRAREAVVPIIVNGLQVPDTQLRGVAAYALGQIGDRRAVGPLMALLQEFYGTTPLMVAAQEQVVLGDRSKTTLLRQEYDSQCNVRSTVIWALGQLRDPIAVPIVRQALTDTSSVVREAAAEALARFDDSPALLVDACINFPSLQPAYSMLLRY